ncbi:helix-turn-helix domain-containing protein [candidate division KSB1 bacterium]|nr:helix-turn-helix domain-containing protein [candidate division KSB1 bacterium]
MPVTIGGKSYYRTAEVANLAGVSKATLERWIKTGKVDGASKKDVRGWRLFTENDLAKIKQYAETVQPA